MEYRFLDFEGITGGFSVLTAFGVPLVHPPYHVDNFPYWGGEFKPVPFALDREGCN